MQAIATHALAALCGAFFVLAVVERSALAGLCFAVTGIVGATLALAGD